MDSHGVEASDRFSHFVRSPSIHIVGEFTVPHSTEAHVVVEDRCDLVLLAYIQPYPEPNQGSIPWLKDQQPHTGDPVHFQQGAVGRITVVEPAVDDAKVEVVIRKRQVFSVLKAPQERSELVCLHSSVQVRDDDILEPAALQNIAIEPCSTENQNSHFSA
jgi:hypothetical protein